MTSVRVVLPLFFSLLTSWALADVPQVSDAWVRAMPPGQEMTAAYLQLHNPGTSTVSILGVRSDAGMASLHETRVDGGRSTMRPVGSLTIEAGGGVSMAPGGLHIMLMGLKSTPAVGDTVPVCLQTSEGDVCVEAAVTRTAPGAQDRHDHH